MANHEVTFTCKNCGLQFNARIYGAVCPKCQAISSTPTPKIKRAPDELFHIPDPALNGAGFTKSVLFDDDGDDKYRIEIFSKPIAEGLAIEVTFGYWSVDKAPYQLIDSYVEIMIGYEGIKLAINNLADLLRLTDTLIKSIKVKKYADRCC